MPRKNNKSINKKMKLLAKKVASVLNIELNTEPTKEMGFLNYEIMSNSTLNIGTVHNSKSKSLYINVGSYDLLSYKKNVFDESDKSFIPSEEEYFMQSTLRDLVISREKLQELEKLMNEYKDSVCVGIGLHEEGCYATTD
ncbi:hypothetical protein BZF66_06545 [Salmonella enterica]|uniref:hypothetical protein n=1 Tax=Salmonella enterica TaxID=28901 RepID=UPI00137D89AD|nr:hypothetical protein [Salmonella enterica]ECV9084088.1 hypothetical protein [Salmonella enterica subsp. enterica serovar Infantis]ELL7856546.1 hypothetical protein [Salmonella enterica]EME3783123.1 hypothetical protein [Salmonella enterica]MCP0435811.1 hypothetical protein [Salmonella enterica subsp. enterica serovar Mbandaka]